MSNPPVSNVSHAPLYRRLSSLGFSLIPLKPRSKKPKENSWSSQVKYTPDGFDKVWNPGDNVGIRLGDASQLVNGDYLIAVDFDLPDPAYEKVAYRALEEVFPDWQLGIAVKSGSKAGLGRHFWFTSDGPIAKRQLKDSGVTIEVQGTDEEGKPVTRTKSTYQIDLFGSGGHQVVAPGSIHPDGNAYTFVDPEACEKFLAQVQSKQRASNFISHDKLMERAFPNAQDQDKSPIEDIQLEDVRKTLTELPPEYASSYNLWQKVAAALHHQFEGSDLGQELFNEFSSANNNPKYSEAVCIATYNACRDRKKSNNYTFRSIRHVVKEYQATKIYLEMCRAGDYTSADTQWINKIDRKKSTKDETLGLPKDTSANYTLIIKNDPRISGVVCYNEFRNAYVVRKDLPAMEGMFPITVKDKINGDLLTDDHIFNLTLFFQNHSDKTRWYIPTSSASKIREPLFKVARENRFNPVKEYLTSTPWDGIKRMERLFPDYAGTPDDAYHREVSRLMLLGIVARIYEPGCKFDSVVMIEGKQGGGKTTFLQALAVNPKWFNSLTYIGGAAGGNKNVENIQGVLINELSETAGLNRADMAELKAFLTNTVDKTRLAYKYMTEDYPRQGIFVGTTNNLELADHTGNRRYLPIHVNVLDVASLRRDVHQIWAESLEAYRVLRRETPESENVPLVLRGVEANERAEEFRYQHATVDAERGTIYDMVSNYLATHQKVNVVSVNMLLVEALGLTSLGSSAGETNSKSRLIGNAMRMMEGWEQVVSRVALGGKKHTLFNRSSSGDYFQGKYTWDGGGVRSSSKKDESII